jgi:hypothetical protein
VLLTAFDLDDIRPTTAALRYAAAGVPVLPLYEIGPDGTCACRQDDCRRAGKHPRLPRGVHDASTSVDLVARWWRWWPGANVGAATGHAFDVWDIDRTDAAPVLAEYLDVPDRWPMVRTGGGGTHVFVDTTGLGNRTRFLPDCDWRGRGGYVVLPPSQHESGRRYRWHTPLLLNIDGHPGPNITPGAVPVRAASARLLAALCPQPSRATPAAAWHANTTTGYAAAALHRECAQLAGMPPDSGRNNALNRAAFNLGQLVASGILTASEVTAALAHAAAQCRLDDREAARTIASGLAAGQRHPRTRRGAA